MISSKSSFKEVFGDYEGAYTEEERKKRWEEFKNASSKSQVDFWQETEACAGCIHLDMEQSWCNKIGLPCTVNPVFGFSMLGMACGGTGKELKQKELFQSNLFKNG